MARTAILAIRIISDATKAAKGFQQAETGTAKFERRLEGATRKANATTVALAAGGAVARKYASDAQQSAGAVEAVYGKQAGAVRKAARSAANDLGLARSEYEQMSAVFGAQLKNLGVATDQLVPSNQKLIKLGGDLAATFGGSTSDAVEALGSLLRGERDPIERYGVSIKQADVNARLAANGQKKLTGAAKRQAETEATLALLYEQTAAAQGQRAREANTDAVASERATAKLKNAAASLGATILPITTQLANGLATVAGFAERNTTAVTVFLAVLAGGAAVVYAVNAAYRIYRATLVAVTVAKKAATAAQYAMGAAWLAGRVAALAYATAIRLVSAAMRANPVGLLITALTVVGGLFVAAYKKSSTFRGIVQATGRAASAALGWIVDKAKAVGTWLGKLGPAATKAKNVAVGAFKLYVSPITLVIDAVKRLIGWLGRIKFPKPPKWLAKAGGSVAGLFGSATQFRGGAGATTALRPSVFTAPGELKAASSSWTVGNVGGRRAGMGGVTIVNLNVEGKVIDRRGTAEALEELLKDLGLSRGRPVSFG